MIRTGYLRWEIEVDDARSAVDPKAREVKFLARPSYRVVRVKAAGHQDAAGFLDLGSDLGLRRNLVVKGRQRQHAIRCLKQDPAQKWQGGALRQQLHSK